MKAPAMFVLGLAVGAAAGIGGIVHLNARTGDNQSGEMAIMFAEKWFYDSSSSVTVYGTLTGPDTGNNSYAITCFQDRKECWVASVDAIGDRHISHLEGPYSYDIRSWSKGEIVAGDDGAFACFKTTITIDRGSKQVLWLEEPVNQSKPFCKDAKNEVRKMTIEDSPGVKRLKNAVSR